MKYKNNGKGYKKDMKEESRNRATSFKEDARSHSFTFILLADEDVEKQECWYIPGGIVNVSPL